MLLLVGCPSVHGSLVIEQSLLCLPTALDQSAVGRGMLKNGNLESNGQVLYFPGLFIMLSLANVFQLISLAYGAGSLMLLGASSFIEGRNEPT